MELDASEHCHEIPVLLAFKLKGEAMKRNQFAFVCIVLVAVLGLVQGCSRGPSEEDLKFAAFQEQFAAVQSEYDALLILRTEIEAADLALVELQAIPENKLTDEQKAEIEELQARLEAATSERETAFEMVQGQLADLLNVGINTIRKPRRPRLHW